MVRTTHTKFLDWGDWGRVERVGRHLSNFKKHAYQSCSKEGNCRGVRWGGGIAGSTGNQRFVVSVGKCLR